MKQVIKEEINKLYSLFKAPPKLDVKSTQQHLDTFTHRTVSKEAITPLKRAVNQIKSIGKCAWCGASKDRVQNSLTDERSRKEYQISALCKPCQDDVFKKPVN
jgi:recombinational DNA repair protein RecR|tara:strand:- start:2027 stop:2335 length:309 start_codon:yes stop_codon:yes gene_type:complete